MAITHGKARRSGKLTDLQRKAVAKRKYPAYKQLGKIKRGYYSLSPKGTADPGKGGFIFINTSSSRKLPNDIKRRTGQKEPNYVEMNRWGRLTRVGSMKSGVQDAKTRLETRSGKSARQTRNDLRKVFSMGNFMNRKDTGFGRRMVEDFNGRRREITRYYVSKRWDWARENQDRLAYITGAIHLDIGKLIKRFGHSVLDPRTRKNGVWYERQRTGSRLLATEVRTDKEGNVISRGDERTNVYVNVYRQTISTALKKNIAKAVSEENKRRMMQRRAAGTMSREKYLETMKAMKDANRRRKKDARRAELGKLAHGNYVPGSEFMKRAMSKKGYEPYIATFKQMLSKIEYNLLMSSYTAEKMLMKELDEAKQWTNLTGNATTGLVSSFYFRNSTGTRTMTRRQPIQLPSAHTRKATRKMIGASSDFAKGKAVGRFYDDRQKWFTIPMANTSFIHTSGETAYNRAMKMISAFNPRGTDKSTIATIIVVSGADYIHTLDTTYGESIMLYAKERAEQLTREYIQKLKH